MFATTSCLPTGFRRLRQVLLFAVICFLPKATGARKSLGCYKCVSKNGSDPLCEDPFSPALNRNAYYHPACFAAKPGNPDDPERIYQGEFPAHFCVKIKGWRMDGYEYQILIRTCTISNLGQSNGIFQLGNDNYVGHIMSCVQDGCNCLATASAGALTIVFGIVATRAVVGFRL